MALNVRSLHKSTLTTTTEGAHLYAPGSGKAAIVKCIRLVNKGTAAATVNLAVRQGPTVPGSYYRIAPKDLSLPPGALYCDDQEVTLEGGDGSTTQDHIVAWVSASSTVDVVLSGVERDQS